MDAILTYDLSKEYKGNRALQRLNLQVPEGQILACVGRKNDGKTTLIRLLSGLCRPSAGEAFVLGLSPFFEADKLHAVTGTVLSTALLYRKMTLTENLRFFAGINGIDENDALDRMSFLLHRLDIWEGRDEPIDRLPTGVRRRASLARALMHKPKVLLLDEPEEGLDKEAADSVRSLLTYLKEQEGVTTLVCTENLGFARHLGDEFLLLRNGFAMAKGDLESLRKKVGVRYRAVLRLGEEETPPKGFQFADGLWEKEICSEEELPKIISRAVADGTKLYEARLIKPHLEEIYTAYLAGQRAGEIDEQDDEYEEQAGAPEEGSVPPETEFSSAPADEAGERGEYETDGTDG